MKDQFRTNQELLKENTLLKKRIQELEQSESERKKEEEVLRKSEEYFKAIIQNSSDIILVVDKLANITYASPSVERVLGYRPDELIGTRTLDLIASDEKSRSIVDFSKALSAKEGLIPNDFRLKHKNGTKLILEGVGYNLLDNPIVAGFVMNARDITKRKQAEEKLRESEEKFRWVLDNISDVISVMDMNLRFTYVSPSILRMRGYTAEEATAQTFEQVMTPESLQIAAKVFEEEMKMETSGTADPKRIRIVEVEQYRKDGSIVVMENSLSFMRDKAQKPVGIISVSRDITERKRAENKIRESEERFRAIFERSTIGKSLTTPDGTFLRVNKAFADMLGYTIEEIQEISFANITHPDDVTESWECIRSLLADEQIACRFEKRYIHKKGDIVWVDINTTLLRDEQGTPFYLITNIVDITNRKKTEEKLQDTLERLRNAVGTTIQVMVSAVESRDPYTAGHQLRVADLSRAIATEMKFSPDRIEGIRMAASIHDIGKLSIPAEILSKPGKLSDLEFSLIKEHPRKGYEMLKDVESPWPLAEIVYQHHERMNGSGYPRSLKGDEILMEARIMAVADVVEAMASHRPYRPGLGIGTALEEIEKNRGTIYDEAVADVCLRLFREKGFQLKDD
jgi:PAS domain S-box-containing protein